MTRQEDHLDPEFEAEFDREYEKMMADSLDSRKFERKTLFDVPLPVRRAQRGASDLADETDNTNGNASGDTMAFSLMTKKANRPQTRTIELPSDSSFALTMKSQQAAEREEQQRIKNLVLNYDLRDESERHDDHLGSSLSRYEKNSARNAPRARRLNLSDVDWT